MEKILLYVLIGVLGMTLVKCNTSQVVSSNNTCIDKKVDSLFNYNFQQYEKVLQGETHLSQLSKEGKIIPYLFIPQNKNGKISIDWAGTVHFDSLAVVEWQDWYNKYKCSISWSDVQYGLNIYDNFNSDLDIDKEMLIIDSLFTN